MRVKATTTSQSSVDSYKCPICKDTTWIQLGNGYKRCSCYKKKLAVGKSLSK